MRFDSGILLLSRAFFLTCPYPEPAGRKRLVTVIPWHENCKVSMGAEDEDDEDDVAAAVVVDEDEDDDVEIPDWSATRILDSFRHSS